ncbi:MAG: hypothetical protein V4696_03555 [Pseudomonadota bacterium]
MPGTLIRMGLLRAIREHGFDIGRGVPSNDEIPSGLPDWQRALRAAAFDARARGAEISLVRSGMIVRKAGASEIVRLDQVEAGILLNALDRVAPWPGDRD